MPFNMPIDLISADVKSAFASITIAELIEALTDLNIPALLQVALLSELEQLSAEATVADAPASNIFEFSKGGREGGGRHSQPLVYFSNGYSSQ